jgi:enoyl-CoA hydratase
VAHSAITFEKRQHVVGITLNRPQAGNVIDLRLAQELNEACLDIKHDAEVRVVLITANGDAFCRGGELERARQAGEALADLEPYRVASAVADLEQPVIAAINGDALGQGLELALGGDIRLASPNARFGFPPGAAGLIPMDGGTQRLPRIVGKGKALEMVFTGELLGAEEALEIGLLSRVVAPEELLAEAWGLAENLATKAPIALRYAKEAISKGLDLPLSEGLRLEADLYFLLHTTADRTEGIRAFLEKRSPRFEGR